MTASAFLNDYKIVLQAKEEDIITLNNVAQSFKNEHEYPVITKETTIEDYNKIFRQTTLSIKKFANSCYKSTTSLEPSDIEQIKKSLNNYACGDAKVKEFKQELIDDLTEFQKQIRTSYTTKIAEYTKKKLECEKQIGILEFEKNKLIMERLSRIEWPYDAKTKEYENKIASLEIQAKQYGQKAEQIQTMRPAANEKEILLYELKLKEKFANFIK